MTVPAPAHFTDLRQFLHEADIDAAYLCLKLEQYLSIPDNLPKSDFRADPHEEHQAWQFRQTIQEFRAMIIDKPDQGNGETDESEES